MIDKKEIETLAKELENADYLYYNFGTSEYTDEEYDAMEDRLFKLDPKNKRFKDGKRNIVGAKTDKNDRWEKVKHNYKMGSQLKITTFDGLKKWANDLGQTERYVVQDKLDGISIRLEYKDGELIEAVTRGDGHLGENILRNVLKMEGIPSIIKCEEPLSVRGEILLFKSNFHHFEDGKTLRNVAAGTSKRLDGKGCDWLNVKVYDVQNWKDFGFNKVSSSLEFLQEQGFDVVNYKVVKTLDDVQNVFDKYVKSIRDSLDWDIDGLVIKAGLFEDDDWAAPKRSIAYKFPAKTAVTKLLDVVWQDSGGRISPVAILDPAVIDGVTISRATLNNVDHIKKLNIKIGDTVEISRRNDVIPCIEKVLISDKTGKDISPPTHDEDGFPIVHETNADGEKLVYLISTNPNSKSKIVRSIVKWFTAHDAKGIAEATAEALFDANIIKDLPSFYDVCMNGHDDLMSLDGFGSGTYKIMKKAALTTCKTTLVKFLTAMDLNNIGSKIIESILSFNNKKIDLDSFIDYVKDINTISNIPGIGINTAKQINNEIKKKLSLISAMKTRVQIDTWEPVKASSTKVNGLSFCFTGKMDSDRNTLENIVKENSGIVAGVSKTLNYLVTNDPNSGSSKNQKVDKINSAGGNIKRITEKEFFELIK